MVVVALESSEPLHAPKTKTAATRAAITILVFPARFDLNIVALLVGLRPASPPVFAVLTVGTAFTVPSIGLPRKLLCPFLRRTTSVEP